MAGTMSELVVRDFGPMLTERGYTIRPAGQCVAVSVGVSTEAVAYILAGGILEAPCPVGYIVETYARRSATFPSTRSSGQPSATPTTA